MTTTWITTEKYGPKADECVERAIIHARLTGSTGATFIIDDTALTDGVESGATVTREKT